MRNLLIALTFGLSLVAAPALADHKAGHSANNPNAPGQDRVCLVTTSGGLGGDVLGGKWLPRKAAEAQADDDTTFVGTHPTTFTKEGCEALGNS